MILQTTNIGKALFLLIATCSISGLVACGGSSSNGSGTTTTPPPAISVSIATPPTTLVVGGSTGVSATVLNDSANAGVTWAVTCGSTASGACGTFTSTSSLSGASTTYTAPTAVPTGSTVTITATSVTDTTKSASATVTITATAATTLGAGNYVFSLTGQDTFTNGPYFVSGVVTVNSSGAITGGEQDFVDYQQFAVSDLINPVGSTITTTADGNLQIVLTTCNATDCSSPDTQIGVSGVETLNSSLVSSSRGLIIEFDTSATSSGTLDLQTSTAAPSAGYAFGITGLDTNGIPLFIGGVINIDGSGTISGTGSIFDANDGGTLFPSETLNASTVSAPDTMGRVTFNLTPTDTTDFASIALVGYIVDAGHIRLVETLDNYLATTGGTALGQTGTGTFSSTSISGNSYVVGSSGADANGSLTLAGLLTFNSDLTIGGNMSFNDFTAQSPQGGATLASGATYTVDASGTGRVTVSNLTDNSTFVNPYTLELYLTGDGHAIAISMDTTDGVYGLGIQQTGGGSFTAGSFAGNYSLNIDQQGTTGGFEYDGVGTVSVDGVSSLTGFLDVTGVLSTPLSPAADDLVAGSFTANASGVFTGTIQGISTSSGSNADNFTYYLVDATKGFAIENDADQLTLGYFELQ